MSLGGFVRRTGFWIKDFFKGSPVRKNYKSVEKVFRLGKDGKRIQQKYLADILSYATENCPFYAPYKGKDIEDFPVVNKSIMNENYDKVVVPREKIPFQKREKVYLQKTSGSTGTPFSVYQDDNKRFRRIAELKFFGKLAGYNSHERLGQCRVWTHWHSKSKKQQFFENIIAVNVSKMDEKTVEELIDTVKEKKIKALLGYANWFDIIADYLERHPEKLPLPSLKVIITSSEMLKDGARNKLKRLLNVNVVERYANEEEGILGQQSVDGGREYYLNHGSYYFEVLKMDSDRPADYGELGRIVITDLFNRAFPLIRYDTGDMGIMQQGNEKSRGADVLKELYGRRLDLIFSTDGAPVQPMSLARVLKNVPEIIQWQFIQKGEKEYLLRVNHEKPVDLGFAIGELKKALGDGAEISVEKVDEIPVLSSGKRKSVVQEWKK